MQYRETETSTRARELFNQRAQPGSAAAKKGVEYRPDLRAKWSEGEKLNVKTIGEVVQRASYPQDLLVRLCVELNLTAGEARKIIKERFKGTYKDWKNKELAQAIEESQYPDWCEYIGIEPE